MSIVSPYIEPPARVRNIGRLYHWCQNEYRENPLVQRVWKKYQKWIWIGFVMTMLSWGQALGVFVDVLPPDHFLAPFAIVLMVISSVLGCFAYIYLLILAIMSVVTFGPNVYNMTFGREEGLQSVPLSFEERIAAVLVPYLRGFVIVLAPYVIGTFLVVGGSLLILLVGIPSQSMPQRMELFIQTLTTGLTSVLWLIYFPIFILVMAMMVIRRLIQHRECGAMPNTGFFYVAGPFILYMVIWVAISALMCCAVPFSFMLAGDVAGFGISMAIILLISLISFLLPPVICWYMLRDWLDADLTNAKKYLFQPAE